MNQSLTVGDRLAALLAELYAKGTIPRNRHGHIARDQLAGMLGVGKTSLTPHLALVNSYQEKIGILHPIDAAIPRMKALLAELIDAGTLTVRDGRVDRKQVGDLAGVNSVTSLMDRFPQLREFFKDADEPCTEFFTSARDPRHCSAYYLKKNSVMRVGGRRTPGRIERTPLDTRTLRSSHSIWC